MVDYRSPNYLPSSQCTITIIILLKMVLVMEVGFDGRKVLKKVLKKALKKCSNDKVLKKMLKKALKKVLK